MGQTGLFFVYFWSFQTKNTILTTNQCEKCHVHPVYGLEFEPTTFGTRESPPITTRPGLPPLLNLPLPSNSVAFYLGQFNMLLQSYFNMTYNSGYVESNLLSSVLLDRSGISSIRRSISTTLFQLIQPHRWLACAIGKLPQAFQIRRLLL